MRIDSSTTVPLGWVVTAFVTLVAVTAAGAVWCTTINDRLSRIEDKMGLPRYETHAADIVNHAFAK